MSQQSQEYNSILEHTKNTIRELNSYVKQIKKEMQYMNCSNMSELTMLLKFTEHEIQECKNISKDIRNKLKNKI